MKKCALISLLLFAAAAGFAASDDDWGFYYQAQILDKSGNAICNSNGQIIHSHKVTLALYTQSKGGTALWSGTFTVPCDDNGLFNVFVATSAATNPSGALEDVFRQKAGQNLYVGLRVSTQGAENIATTEISPRQLLSNVPYAAYANAALNLIGDPATVSGDLAVASNVTVSGALTAEALTVSGDLNFVSSITVGGVGIECVPVGGIILWDQANPPSGTWSGSVSSDGYWRKCDGSVGTPDLAGRFPIGVGGNYSRNAQGGAETVTLTTVPAHFHQFMADDSYKDVLRLINEHTGSTAYGYWGYCHPISYYDSDKGKTRYKRWNCTDHSGTKDDWKAEPKDDHKTYWVTTGGACGVSESPNAAAAAHNNMPPYYVVQFIMRMN